MTDQELKDIEARCEKASKGPWFPDENGGVDGPGGEDAESICEYSSLEDADFIAYARTDIPALLEALKQEREKVAVAEQWISADQEPEIYDQFEVYATLNGEWKIKDATFSFEFERFIFDGCQEWIPMFYRKVELPNQ